MTTPAKIKIAYIMPSLARGGAERFLLDLLSQIDRQRFEPIIILFKEKGVLFDELQKLAIETFVLEKKTKFDFNNIWQIYQILRKESPDIVHTQLGGDIRGKIAAKLARIKILISTEQNLNFTENREQRWAKIITSLWTKTIVAISPAVAKDMAKRYLLPKNKGQIIIPNGININKFPYQENRPEQTPLIAGAAGRLVKQKGFDLLITAWQKLFPQDIKLLIAGEGPEKENLKTQIKEAGLEKQIELIGPISLMTEFYQQLNLFIMPSRWEGLGIAALEAGAMGVPVLASDADGLKEIIKPEKTGWTCQAGSTKSLEEGLAEALSFLGNEGTKLKQKNLRKLIIENFTIQQVTQRYEELYLKLWQESYENTAS